jgi:hypothetical protein
MMPGLAKLTEEIAGAPPPGLVDELWRLVYTRGHCDVDRARPQPGRQHAGVLVFARVLDGRHVLVVVETGDRLVGTLATWAPIPPLGSAVRLAPGGSAGWHVIVDESLPLPLDVRFDAVPPAGERVWVRALREALCAIRASETVRRDGIAARRRALPPMVRVPSREDVVRQRFAELRPYCEREVAVAKLRDELPELHRRIREMQIANATTQGELVRLEGEYAHSRARTQSTYVASRFLDALADAPFTVSGLTEAPDDLDDPARADDVLRTISLLARALPRGAARVAV